MGTQQGATQRHTTHTTADCTSVAGPVARRNGRFRSHPDEGYANGRACGREGASKREGTF